MKKTLLLLALGWGSLVGAQKKNAVAPKATSNPVENTDSSVAADNQYFAALKWRSIGPFRGGRVNAAVGLPQDPTTYYMGTTGGGVWKSTDMGGIWQNVSDGFFNTHTIGAIAVAAINTNVVYVGTGEHAIRGVMTHSGDGLYKSTDAGKTWQHMGLRESRHIADVVVDPHNDQTLWVAAQGALYAPNKERGIYKSTDGGKSWKQTLYINDSTGCTELCIDPHNPLVLYASMWEHGRKPWQIKSGGPGSGIYQSVDGGETWKKLSGGLPKLMGKSAVAVSGANGDKVYALVESDFNTEAGGLYVSDDAGESWRQVSKDHRLIQRAWYYIELFTDPQNEQTIYVLSAPMLRSKDGGKTWENLGGTHGDYHNLWINPTNPKHLVVSNDGGAAISFNGGETWTTQNNQPTAQIYRISVDNEFPYHIYGGQQDNTSVKIPSRALGAGNIDLNHWFESAGGESAFLAFDPNNPRYVMGGSYQGTIEILDSKTLGSTKVMPSPIQYLGKDAAEMKYRYNWNAPIIRSVHEENTFYHGAQLLLRSRDMGRTWQEVSPDLTRNEKDKQGKPGIPFTNEAVGAENYGTLAYVMESPLEKGLIYTGSDDGLVYMTQDNGAHWTNITPAGLEPCLVNAIEVSPFDKGTVYIATTRYKFNDHRPGLYKSTDYGKTWKAINKGIKANDFTRVVREDQVQKGLLFAGTEHGLYLSWDGGENWKPFSLNLPPAPITDLKVHQNNLIAATSGRSFWILDDLELLRQCAAQSKPGAKMVLYQPKPAMLMTGYSEMDQNGNPSGTNPTAGVNPATGLVLYYHLPALPDTTELSLVITNEKGETIHRYSSQPNELFAKFNGRPGADPRLPKNQGLNRFVWNLRHETVQGIPGVYIESSFRGHKAIPGKYTLTLKAGKEEQVITTAILPNPLFGVDPKDYAQYEQVMTAMEKDVNDMHQMVNNLNAKRQQLSALLQQWPDHVPAALKTEAQRLVNEMKKWDEDMIQRKSTAYDDVENFPNKFTAQYMFTMNQAESDLPRINQPILDEWKQLQKNWSVLRERGMSLQNKDLPALNQKMSAAGIGVIWKDF